MAINYSIAQMKNPNDKGAPAKYYAKAQASGSVDINELAEEISYSTTLTDGDVLNVIRALVKQINKHISKGEIVKLENLGSFQAPVSSNLMTAVKRILSSESTVSSKSAIFRYFSHCS